VPEHGAGGSGGGAEGDLISREAMVIRQEAIVPGHKAIVLGHKATVLRCEAVVPGHEAVVLRPEATIFRWEAVVFGYEAVVGRYGVESFPGNYFPFYSGIFVPVLVGALEGGRVWKKRNTTERAGGVIRVHSRWLEKSNLSGVAVGCCGTRPAHRENAAVSNSP